MEQTQESQTTMNAGGKTTITFRIMPHEKLLLATKAQALGLSPSQYIEALVLEQHNELMKRMQADAEQRASGFSGEEEKLYDSLLKNLWQRYPKSTYKEIVLACLAHAWENHDAIWERSLGTFLKRIRNRYYKS